MEAMTTKPRPLSLRLRLPMGLLALALAIAGCSDSNDGPAPGTPAGSEVPADSDEGGGGGEVDLGDFPIAAPPGAESSISAGGGRIQSLVYPVDQYDAIVAFYEEWTAANLDADPPPTLTTDAADRQFGATGTIAGVGIMQITLGETDGELRLGLSVIPTE